MALEGVSKLRLVGAVIGFILSFIASCLLWNVYSDDLDPGNDDLSASINYYIFTLWIFSAACIFAIVKAGSPHVHNALVIFSLTVYAVLFVGVNSPDGNITTSFASLTFIREALSNDEDNDVLSRLFVGGLFANAGMLLSMISTAFRINITDSGKIVKLIATVAVCAAAVVGILIFWGQEELRDPNNTGVYAYTAAVLIVIFATLVTAIGSHKGAAAFLLAYGGFFSLYALSSGLLISSGETDDAKDAARAGMVFCSGAALVSLIPAFLVYQDESADSTA